MEPPNVTSMSGKDILKLLKTYKQYENLSDYYIKKEIGGKKQATVDQLRGEYIKLSSKKELDVLSFIKLHDIDFIYHLSYVDILNICKTNKNLSNICSDNQLFRNILLNKNIILNPNVDIITSLNIIYNQIDKLVYKNFANRFIPAYIKKEAFLKDMHKRIMFLFINNLWQNVRKIVEKKPKTFKIVISKSYLSFPFVGDNYYYVDNIINMTTEVIQYILPAMVEFYKVDKSMDDFNIIQVLYELFFTNFNVGDEIHLL
jgi:hypothetical protein